MSMRNVLVLLALITISLFIGGCGAGAFEVRIIPDRLELAETEIKRDSGFFVSDKIVVIDVDGVMYNMQQGGFMSQGDNPVSTFLEKLDKAAGDKNVKAVVLRLNTPGGSVAATDIMYHNLMEFKKKTGKPVIASMMDMACSVGYYLACGCDGIIAQPSCVTGSIGTIMQTMSFAGAMEKIGVKAVAIKSGKMKDMASPLHDIREEEQQLLQSIIDDFYEQFLGVVRKGRKGVDKSRLRQLADGRVYTARQALKENLIDRIGYTSDGVRWAKKLAGVEKSRTVIYHRPQSYKPNIYGSAMNGASGAGALVNIEIPEWLNSSGVQFLYLWQPGI
jgi:protease-4